MVYNTAKVITAVANKTKMHHARQGSFDPLNCGNTPGNIGIVTFVTETNVESGVAHHAKGTKRSGGELQEACLLA